MAVQEPQPAPQPDPAADDAPRPLLLPSLEVKNFRAFHHLTIEKLGRVNLITGKNNVGKTSLLEALWLYANGGTPEVLRRVLQQRNEYKMKSENPDRSKLSPLFGLLGLPPKNEDPSTSVRFLFNGRKGIHEDQEPIVIGRIETTSRQIELSLQWFREVHQKVDSPDGISYYPPTLVPLAEGDQNDDETIRGFAIRRGDSRPTNYRLEHLFTSRLRPAPSTNRTATTNTSVQFVRSNGVASSTLEVLWDNVTLTPLEDDVIKALRLLLSDVVGVNLRADPDDDNTRVPVVKSKSLTEPLPLRSFGDGMNRLFGVVLALVNATGGLLLLDEIENGIHYSVMPDVWRLIFQTARRLNVQVFATTHSWDCIEAFQAAAAEDDDPGSGVLVRLDNKGGDVSATVFDERRLAIVTRDGIEVR